MFIRKVFAQSKGRASTTRTADDRAYTAWAQGQAAAAGVRNPAQYVANNVARSNAGGGVQSRNRVMGQINRRG